MASDKLLKCNDSNLRDIKKELDGNLELQMIVLGTIQDYKKAAGDAGRTKELVAKRKERGERTAATQKAKKARCADGAGEDAAPTAMTFVNTPGEMTGGETDLPKGCKSYGGWKVGFFVELFKYCEPSLFSDAMKAIDSKKLARQLFEFAFGLKAGAIDGEIPDKPGTLRKFNCFAALREVYIANGRPFRKLIFGAGGVDWSKPGQGVYQLVTETIHDDLGSGRGRPRTKFLVRNTIASRTVEMVLDFLGDISGEEYTALRIDRNFSASGASLLSICAGTQYEHQELNLSDCFPRHVKTLRRRISDTLEASSEVAISGTNSDAARPKPPLPSLAEAAIRPLRPSLGSSASGTGSDEVAERPASEDAAGALEAAAMRCISEPIPTGFGDAPASPEPTFDAAEIDAAEERATTSAEGLLASLATPALLRSAASSGDVISDVLVSPGR